MVSTKRWSGGNKARTDSSDVVDSSTRRRRERESITLVNMNVVYWMSKPSIACSWIRERQVRDREPSEDEASKTEEHSETDTGPADSTTLGSGGYCAIRARWVIGAGTILTVVSMVCCGVSDISVDEEMGDEVVMERLGLDCGCGVERDKGMPG